jgi:ABC-type oligopeptide transport system substrate-binding subunit
MRGSWREGSGAAPCSTRATSPIAPATRILQANLRAIGIDLDVRQFPLGEFFGRVKRPGEPWDLAYWNWFPDFPDPANFIDDQFGPAGQIPAVARAPAIEDSIADAAA